MTTTHTPERNSSSVSIREARLQRCATDTNEHEKSQTPTLSIEGLRNIGRVMRDIKAKIDAATGDNQDGSPACTSHPGSIAATCPMGSEDTDSTKKEKR
jgi:hypothetical protein